LRGNDIEFNPLFFSYAILFKDFLQANSYKLILYSNPKKFKEEKIQKHLKENNIEIRDYSDFITEINKHKEILICDKNSLNQNTYEKLKAKKKDQFHILNEDPVQYLKSQKNETETKSVKEANKRDGLCLIRFYSWLEKRLLDCSRDHKLSLPTEYECTQKLIEFRKQGKNYKGESFSAISASGGNGAIIHYRPDENYSSQIDLNKIYLLDSGAQYL
jgi:Xaa-Pro aminopeptidase